MSTVVLMFFVTVFAVIGAAVTVMGLIELIADMCARHW